MFSRFHHPYLLLILTSLFWSGNMVLGRAIRNEVPPLSLAFWRWAIALALTLPLALPHLRSQWPQLKRGWPAIVTLGLLGVGGYNTLAYIALQYTAATNAVLLNSFIPIATIALSWAFLKKHLQGIEWLGVLTSLIGVITIVAHGKLSTLAGLALNIGDLWMLGAVFIWAFYTIGLQWRPPGVHPMLLLAALITVGLLGGGSGSAAGTAGSSARAVGAARVARVARVRAGSAVMARRGEIMEAPELTRRGVRLGTHGGSQGSRACGDAPVEAPFQHRQGLGAGQRGEGLDGVHREQRLGAQPAPQAVSGLDGDVEIGEFGAVDQRVVGVEQGEFVGNLADGFG